MKIAIPVAQGQLCMHFGHCEQFALVDVNTEAKTIETTQYLESPAHQPGLLPRWLAEKGTTVVIAGGMGMRAQNIFKDNGIEVITGASPALPEDIAKAYVQGSLQTGANTCDH